MPREIIIAVIPARYGSTRFPGKVLAKDTGKFLIQHTWERACAAKLPGKVIIAADDKRIADACATFGAECIMTSADCASGTDRIAEAVKKLEDGRQRTEDRKNKKLNAIRYPLSANCIVINLQADEPEIDPANIDKVAELLVENQKSKTCPEHSRRFKNQNCGMATLAAEFESHEQIADPNIVKVVVTQYARRSTHDRPCKAIYFSRSIIPYDREQGGIGPVKNYLRHIGIYAYRKDFLLRLTSLPQTPLEKIEKLEQLRAIENGFDILVAKVKHTCDGIDTPEQYAEFVKRYKEGRRGK